jgi:hypothetical protein
MVLKLILIFSIWKSAIVHKITILNKLNKIPNRNINKEPMRNAKSGINPSLIQQQQQPVKKTRPAISRSIVDNNRKVYLRYVETSDANV